MTYLVGINDGCEIVELCAGFTGRIYDGWAMRQLKMGDGHQNRLKQLLESMTDLQCCVAINSDSAMSLAYNQAHFVCETWDDDLPHSL